MVDDTGNARVEEVAFDPDAVRAKYLAERDRRLVPGRADIRDLDAADPFARYRDDPFTPMAERDPRTDEVDVVILGGGIGGILAGVELRKAGIERIRIVDQAGGIGGTWYWNRYPGVMCDIESYIYLPMLEELDYIPTKRYASGEEILHHLEAIAERYHLVDDALFHTAVTRAEWDDDADRWVVTTDRGDRLRARYYVIAPGILNRLKLPVIAGMESFGGHSFHSARWDYAYTGGAPGEPLTELADKRVAVIGTGATGIQTIRPLADAAEHVYVFQRTPSAIGERGDRPTPSDFGEHLEPGWQRARMENFEAIMLGREVGEDLTDDGWTRHYAPVRNLKRPPGMDTAEYVRMVETFDFEIMEAHRDRVAEIVADPATAEALKPYYRYICKRPCFHDEFLAAFNAPNVTLVDCPAGFERITERGPVVDGQQFDVDLIVYATGFEAEITPLPQRAGHEIVGRDGLTLAEKWSDGASTLFGMLIRGFPNLLALPAPGQQAVATVNYTTSALAGAELIGGLVAQVEARPESVFEVTEEAEAAWTQAIVDSFVDASRLMSACTPSRLNLEGHPEDLNPRDGNYGKGRGDYFAYAARLREWLAAGELEGLDLR